MSDVRRPLNEKGIALLLVISSIVILTMVGVEFAYNAQIEYNLATRQKERLQAYYLAYSAYNLVRLELKMGNQVQAQVQSAVAKANINVSADLSTPLCQQFPMKTALFRMVLAGQTGEAEGEAKPEEENAEGEKTDKPNEATSEMLAGLPLQGGEDFLQFSGDFDGECVDEGSKIDLNFFYAQDPSKKADGTSSAYDEYKKFIISMLSQKNYQDLFKDGNIKVTEVVRNIADWIDPNESVSEFGGSEGGPEDSAYHGLSSGQMAAKNGKLSTPDDIYRVEGVQESWWAPIADLFTIYGTTSPQGKPQINVCRAPNEVVSALILRYTETRSDLPPLRAEDEEMLSELVATVKKGCTGAIPDKNKIAADLDAKLLELLKATPGSGGQNQPGKGAPGYGGQGSPFSEWIATQSRFFSLKLLGQVNDTVVNINAVIDLGNPPSGDTAKWKTVYWKID